MSSSPPNNEEETCVVCFETIANVVLQPCSHDLFCGKCARQFRCCPLCRGALTIFEGENYLLWNGRGDRYSFDEARRDGGVEGGGASVGGLSGGIIGGAIAPESGGENAPETVGGNPKHDFIEPEKPPKPISGAASSSLPALPDPSAGSSEQRPENGDNSNTNNNSPKPRKSTRSVARQIASRKERFLFLLTPLIVWVFIFFAGMVEFQSGLRPGCSAGDADHDITSELSKAETPRLYGQSQIYTLDDHSGCELCYTNTYGSNGEICQHCSEGYLSFGWRCYKYLENLPRLKPGGELGGSFYFTLIILTQVIGVGVELLVVHRLRKKDLLPKKDQFVIFLALSVEIIRMLLVDWVVLGSYFSGQGWAVYRAPIEVKYPDSPLLGGHFPLECQYNPSFDHSLTHPTSLRSHGGPYLSEYWKSSRDGRAYCVDTTLPIAGQTEYFLGKSRHSYSVKEDVCSRFTSESAVLDFDRTSPDFPYGGAPRFENLGWIIGGEFAL